VNESVLSTPDSRQDTDSRSVNSRSRTVRFPWPDLPYSVALAGVIAGLGWMWLGTRQIKTGMVVIAAAIIVAAVARLVLPERGAGLLVSRHRVSDVLTLAFFGTCILSVALVLPVRP
jgi:hypothetical protein